MKIVEKTILIEAPIDRVFEMACDTSLNPSWIPSLSEVHDIVGQGIGKTYAWTYQMAGVNLHGSSRCIDWVENDRYTTVSSGNVESAWRYYFDRTTGGTRFTLKVLYKVPIPVLGRLAEPMLLRRNEREAELAVHNLKGLVEAEVLEPMI